jgi:hypothetical protein
VERRQIAIQLGEDAAFDGLGVRYLDGRQTALHLIATGERVDTGGLLDEFGG